MVAENSKDNFRFLLPRYFAHGLVFSMFTLIFGFVWVALVLGLIVLGALIGLIIGILLLFYVFGAINAFLMGQIWNIQVHRNWKSLLIHGLALYVAFLAVSIPSFFISFYMPSLPSAAILFIAYCFIDGYVAKTVGGHWKEEGSQGEAHAFEFGFVAKMAVFLMTALAGTGFAVGLLLLLWSLLGGYWSEFLLFLTVFSGVATFIGLIILSLTKTENQ